MKNFEFRSIKWGMQNLAIGLMIILSLSNVIGLYIWHIHPFGSRRTSSYYGFIAPYGIQSHTVLAFILGFLGLLVAFNLYRKVRSAWTIAIVSQSVLLGLHFVYGGRVFSISSLLSLYILVVLGLGYKDFNRSSERLRLRQALLVAIVPFGIALLNSLLSLSLLSKQYVGSHNVWRVFGDSLNFLFLMDPSLSGYHKDIHPFAFSLILVSWFCAILFIFFILKPLIYNPIVDFRERRKVYELVKSQGQNPMAYMTLLNDKHYFFGEMVEGVLAYVLVNNVLVVCGDILCAKEDAILFLGEIRRFAYKNQWKVLFMDITEEFREAYESQGFRLIKIGEDACIDLSNFSLAGKARAKVRANVNQAKKRGLTVDEYRPLVFRDAFIEHALQEISKEWFKEKGVELGFMLGGLALDNPLGRRYFYSKDETGQIQAFIIFVPYASGKSFMVDVTRRRGEAPNGAMEIIFAEAFVKMAEEGLQLVNLGLCPLANLDQQDEEKSLTAQLFQFVYENLNGVYGFKGLYQAKKKWAPTDWQPRYIACAPKIFGPGYAYAMIKAQNPKGINKLLLEKLRARS
ncbi:MAG: DUF2156 domain-containing protein [Streptococcaceae bacterium]|jgi:phosphatidylglycerol lysyltransferase|nr:DUF2156 domain-containing protein [Streptococcaceae bacterium]